MFKVLEALAQNSTPLKESGLLKGRILLQKKEAHGARVSPWAIASYHDRGISCPTIGSEGKFFLSSLTLPICEDTTYIPSNDLFLLGFLNSWVAHAQFKETASIPYDGWFRFGVKYLSDLPVPNRTEPHCSLIRLATEKAVALTLANSDVMDRYAVRYFGRLIDGLFCELLVPEAFLRHEKAVAKHLEGFDWNRPARAIFREIHDREHPIAYVLFTMDTIPEIRELEKSLR